MEKGWQRPFLVIKMIIIITYSIYVQSLINGSIMLQKQTAIGRANHFYSQSAKAQSRHLRYLDLTSVTAVGTEGAYQWGRGLCRPTAMPTLDTTQFDCWGWTMWLSTPHHQYGFVYVQQVVIKKGVYHGWQHKFVLLILKSLCFPPSTVHCQQFLKRWNTGLARLTTGNCQVQTSVLFCLLMPCICIEYVNMYCIVLPRNVILCF